MVESCCVVIALRAMRCVSCAAWHAIAKLYVFIIPASKGNHKSIITLCVNAWLKSLSLSSFFKLLSGPRMR